MVNNSIVENLLFIVGCPRSGTTLLRRVIGTAPDVYEIPDETAFFRSFYGKYGKPNKIKWKKLLKHFSRTYAFKTSKVSEKKLYRVLEQEEDINYASFYKTFALMSSKEKFLKFPPRIIIEKTPTHTHNVRLICKMFQNAKIIGIVRDPCSVVASNIKYGIVRLWYLQSKRAKIIGGTWEWLRHYKELQKLKEELPNERLLLISFEDLVNRPKKTIEEINSFLNTDIPIDILPFKLDKTRINMYKNYFTKSDIRIIARLLEGNYKEIVGEYNKSFAIFYKIPILVYRLLFLFEVWMADNIHPKIKRVFKIFRGDVVIY